MPASWAAIALLPSMHGYTYSLSQPICAISLVFWVGVPGSPRCFRREGIGHAVACARSARSPPSFFVPDTTKRGGRPRRAGPRAEDFLPEAVFSSFFATQFFSEKTGGFLHLHLHECTSTLTKTPRQYLHTPNPVISSAPPTPRKTQAPPGYVLYNTSRARATAPRVHAINQPAAQKLTKSSCSGVSETRPHKAKPRPAAAAMHTISSLSSQQPPTDRL